MFILKEDRYMNVVPFVSFGYITLHFITNANEVACLFVEGGSIVEVIQFPVVWSHFWVGI